MNTRALSAKILHAVCYEQKSLSDVFNTYLPKTSDAAYIKSLCFGALRFWFALEDILQQLLDKPLKRKDKDIECLLIIGLFQLQHSDTPTYAAINETVSATKALKKIWAKGLVNKILRRAHEERPMAQGDKQYAHPTWLLNKIKKAWPEQWRQVIAANNKQAPLFLRINKTKTKVATFTKQLDENNIPYQHIVGLPEAIQITNPLPVDKIPGFNNGDFSVQDLTGQKVNAYLNLDKKHRVLDACCAPGSKTTHILENFPELSSLIAVDISKVRLQKVSDNIKRLGLSKKRLSLIAANMCERKQWWDGNHFDCMLIDAPCSATGVIRRHPDIKVLRQATDIPTLANVQLEILKTVWPTLKPGGRCIYTTCSILPEENDQVIAHFLKAQPDAQVVKINNDWGINTAHGQQVLPGDRDRDGFYYCILIKT